MEDHHHQFQAVYCDVDLASPDSHQLPGGEVVVLSVRHPEKEPTSSNEDAAAVFQRSDSTAVLLIADGMGGQKSGDTASKIAVDSIEKWVARPPSEDLMLRTAVLNGIEEASRDVIALGLGAGTTIAAVEIQDGTVRPYHVGDSMILVVGQRGKIKLQTVAHSPVGLAVEAGVMDEHEAMHHEDRHLVLNFVGSADMRIEIGSVLALAPHDTVLLASDGLIDNLTVDEIIDHIRSGPLLDAVEAIAAEARLRMTTPEPGHPSKPDDLTLIAYRPNPARA